MNTDHYHKDSLASVLKLRGINIDRYENTLKQIYYYNQNGCFNIIFPHKYLYELYKDSLKYIIENILDGDINYLIHSPENISGNQKSNETIKSNHYSFNNFITDKKNCVIVNICKKIIKDFDIQYNPLTIYGDSSTGKTHIIYSMINKYKNKKIYLNDLYDLFHDINKYSDEHIYNIVINNDIAIIENIQNIYDNKIITLLEKIIDHYYNRKKQIIFTFQGKNINYSKFSKNLGARISSGLILKLNNPDMNARIRFAKKFCSENGINLPSESIFTISSNCDNIRSIKGTLLNLSAFPDDLKKISPKNIRKIFEEKGNKSLVDFKSILDVVSNTTGISASDLLKMNKDRKTSKTRQICMYMCRKKLNWSYPKIGIKFGGRDHSTVIYSVKKIEQLKTDSKEINTMLKDMFQKIENRS